MSPSSTVKPAGAACLECPGRHEPIVLPEPAQGKTHLAIVGDMPTRFEFERKRSFIGNGGRLLMKGIRHLGLTRAQVHWTNAVLCDVGPKAYTKARKQCQARLQHELANFRAPVVVPVGAHGLRSTLATKSTPMMKWRGSVSVQAVDPTAFKLTGAPFTRYVMPTIHPSFALRSPLWMPILELDIERVGRVLKRGYKPPEALKDRKLVIARDLKALLHSLRSLGPVISADVETVGLGATETRLVCLAFSDGPLTLVVPWTRDSAGLRNYWPDSQSVAAMLTSAMSSRTTVTHNGYVFDHIVMGRYGIHVGEKVEDTLQASHALESHLPRGLARVATTYLDVGPWKQWESRSSTIEELWVYNGRDALYTILAWLAMKEAVT